MWNYEHYTSFSQASFAYHDYPNELVFQILNLTRCLKAPWDSDSSPPCWCGVTGAQEETATRNGCLCGGVNAWASQLETMLLLLLRWLETGCLFVPPSFSVTQLVCVHKPARGTPGLEGSSRQDLPRGSSLEWPGYLYLTFFLLSGQLGAKTHINQR